MIIHYSKATGEIVSWGTAHADEPEGADSHLPGCAVHYSDCTDDISPLTHRFDFDTRALVAKNDEEQRLARLPTIFEIKSAVLSELIATDGFVSPPSDRPRTGPLLFDWLPYREALRDLSKLATATDMVLAWPFRPDGSDAIPTLRERVS